MLLLINPCRQLPSVDNQEGFHCRMADPLVSVEKGVIAYERVSQCRCLLHHARVEVLSSERRSRLRDSRFERSQITNPAEAPGLFEYQAMQFQDLFQVQVADHASRR